jgi:hypothetical protein
MATVQSFIDSARYDLVDYSDGSGLGIEFDDVELLVHLNRMIGVLDSTLAVLNSDTVHETEENIDTVESQNYIDLYNMNGGFWDSIRSVWIGDNKLTPTTLDDIYYKRKFRSDDNEPRYYALERKVLQFECGADAAHTDVVIHYNKKHRPLILSDTVAFTAATTDIVTLASDQGYMQIDGPVTLTNSGGALPAGLSTSTNYWMYKLSTTTCYFCTSLAAAMEGTDVDITDTGSGTHTINRTDIMPYDDKYNEFLREMLVLHAKAKKEGVIEQSEMVFDQIFRGRMMQEEIRRGFAPKPYYIGF